MAKRKYRARQTNRGNLYELITLSILLTLFCLAGIPFAYFNTSSSTFTAILCFGIPTFLIFLAIVVGLINTYLSNQKRQLELQAAYVRSFSGRPSEPLEELSPIDLEKLAASIYQKLGYLNVKHTGVHSSTDGGVDVWMLNPQGHVEIVQCKQMTNRVDRSLLKEFAKTMRMQHAVLGHYWAPGEFTQPAIDYAHEHGQIKLCEKREILQLVEQAFPPQTEPNAVENVSPKKKLIFGLQPWQIAVIGSLLAVLFCSLCGLTIMFIATVNQ